MEKKWEDKAEAWGKESSEGKDEFYMKNSSGRTLLPYLEEELWRKERRNFIDAEYTEVKKATGAAGEAMEALKAFCSAILGTHIPFGDTVFGKYLEEFVSELFSSGIEKSEIPDFVSSIFLDKELGHLNLFSNIGRAEEPIEWKGRVRIHNDNSLLDSRVHEKVDDIHPEEW